MIGLSGPEEAEYRQLLESAAKVEDALAKCGSAPLAHALNACLAEVRLKIEAFEKKAQAAEEERLAKANFEVAAALAEKETALSRAEREQYRQFLEKEHFSKADFGALAGFYEGAYDRLSEGGKDEMSKRVWGGVRAGEYQFIDLPDPVKEKEAQQVERALRGTKTRGQQWDTLPEEQSAEFLKARDTGSHRQSYEILNRPVFLAHAPDLERVPAASARVSTVAVLNAEEKKASPVHAPEAALLDGSLKLELQDSPGLEEGAADLKPPLPNHTASVAAQPRRR